ncbi:MAG: universal stress protein [Rhodospirillales bacterium]
MSIKCILTALSGHDAPEPQADAAGFLARTLSARLTLLHVSADVADVLPLVGEGMSGALIDELTRVTEREGAERRKRAEAIRDRLAEGGTEIKWRNVAGREDEEIAVRGRLADLIVLALPDAKTDQVGGLSLHAALFEAGRPLLCVPKSGFSAMPRHVAISWNGSAQGARAVAAAAPFLGDAEKVTVLNAKTGLAQPVCCEAVINYLDAHGVSADLDSFQPSGSSIGAELLGHCAAGGVDLLVMGAYTHSRMRQLILGGVTSHVLEHASLPVLMAH